MASIMSQPKALAPRKFQGQLTTMDLGIQKYLPAAASLNLDGSVVKQPAVDTQLQSWLQTFRAVDTARQALADAVTARLAITVQARQYYKALKDALRHYFGTQSAMLANFGITPDRAVTTSAKTKLQAVAKRRQTRAVRGTLSKKQKAALTVVGAPPINVSSDGSLEVGAPPVNLPASSSTPSGGSNGNGGSGTPSAGQP
ncbi:MAG TPA: hypothetical protein VMB50_20115 [Myxococcales bacterium]|nr:hypothetical protein [Myxococcales bacterium]